ncbi:hypothetical protein TIFTF001_017374 [Ficus carica]|uniref:Uncharacterized protein n=1 Tax=Ficus carica TaxID=3494 RepID=A0AA88AC37_FICCA|nr:hypothetical protein TIFTF001_017374 [Ficus carica]
MVDFPFELETFVDFEVREPVSRGYSAQNIRCSPLLPCFRFAATLSSSTAVRLLRSPSRHMRATTPFSSATAPVHVDD